MTNHSNESYNQNIPTVGTLNQEGGLQMHDSDTGLNKSVDRKQEFLATALELFKEKGYDSTTIKDIIDTMGVSKGAFYHYFESKEDVISTLAKEYADRAIGIMKRIASRADLSVIGKINLAFQSINQYKAGSEEERTKLKDAFYGEENLKLEKRIFNSFKDVSIDLFQQLIEEGIEEGSIAEPVCSRELAEFMLYTIKNLNSAIDELIYHMEAEDNELDYQGFITRLDIKLQFYEEALNRVFNLQGESIALRESYLHRFVKPQGG